GVISIPGATESAATLSKEATNSAPAQERAINISWGACAPSRHTNFSSRECGRISSVHRDDTPRRARCCRQIHEWRGDPLCNHLTLKKIGAEVGVWVDPARLRTRLEHAIAKERRANSIGVDRITTHAVRTKIDRILAHERHGCCLRDRVWTKLGAGIKRSLRC